MDAVANLRTDEFGRIPSGVKRRYPRNANDAGLVNLGLNSAMANDAFTNAAARMGYGTSSVAEGAEYELVRWSYNYWLMITLYRNQWIPRKIVDIPAMDMVRAWPRLTSDIDPKDLTSLDRVIRNTGTKRQILKTIQWARLFGGAGALIVIDGHENRLDEPLDLDTVELGAYRGLLPFDRWVGIYPDTFVSTDIGKPLEFNLPEHYRVQNAGGGGGFRVHASRILRFTGPQVPAPEYQAQMYWGISVLEIAYEAMKMRDNQLWNMLGLTFRANILAQVNPDLAQMLSGLSTSQNALVGFWQRMQSMNELLSNQNMMILPKDGKLESTQYSFGGCSDMMQQFRYEVSGAASIPEMRLFGHSPTGMGVKDDPAERLYEEMIGSEQEDQMRPALDQLYPVICMSVLGEVPEDLDLSFPSIRILTEEEKVQLATGIATVNTQYFAAGIVKKAFVLQEIKQNSDVTGYGTNVTNEMIAAAEKEDDIAAELMEKQQEAMLAGGLGPGGPEAGEEEGAPVEEGEEESENPESVEEIEGGDPSTQKRIAAAKDSGRKHLNVEFAGIPVTIEYEAGTRRQIRNENDQLVYDRLMKYDYGFIRNTVGRDGDEIDVILGPAENAPNVYIVDMEDLGPDIDKREDEDKVLVGFQSQSSAERAFLSMYPPSFMRFIDEMPRAEFMQRLEDANGSIPEFVTPVGDGLDWEESKHPRGQPENGGQFVPKGATGAGATLKAAATAAVKAYNEANFRAPTKADIDRIFPSGKLPGGWKAGSARINPDPNADVVAIGTMKKSSKKDFKMSKAWVEKNKAFREKNWTKAQQALKVPATSRNVWLATDPKADKQAVYISSTGVPYTKEREEATVRKAKKKFADTAKCDANFDKIWARIRKGVHSRDIDVRHAARAVALTSLTSARIGGTKKDDRIMPADEFVQSALYEIVTTGDTDWKKLGAPSNKPGTRFRATGAGTGTGEAGLLKDWDEEPTTKVPRPGNVPKTLSGAIAKIASDADSHKVIDHANEYAYVKSNFYQSEIDREVAKAVKSKTITAEEGDAFLENLEEKTRQWPKWATELDYNDLPKFGSSGILTLRPENIQEEDGKLYMRFIGKEAKPNSFEVDDPEMQEWLLESKREGEKDEGRYLFPYADQGDCNKFSKSVGASKTKEFRTRIGTNRAKEVMANMPAPKTAAELKRSIRQVGRHVARQLQNTWSAAIKSYVDPKLFQDWENGIS